MDLTKAKCRHVVGWEAKMKNEKSNKLFAGDSKITERNSNKSIEAIEHRSWNEWANGKVGALEWKQNEKRINEELVIGSEWTKQKDQGAKSVCGVYENALCQSCFLLCCWSEGYVKATYIASCASSSECVGVNIAGEESSVTFAKISTLEEQMRWCHCWSSYLSSCWSCCSPRFASLPTSVYTSPVASSSWLP